MRRLAVTFREVLQRGLLGACFADLVLAPTARHQTNEIASGSLSRRFRATTAKGVDALFAAADAA